MKGRDQAHTVSWETEPWVSSLPESAVWPPGKSIPLWASASPLSGDGGGWPGPPCSGAPGRGAGDGRASPPLTASTGLDGIRHGDCQGLGSTSSAARLLSGYHPACQQGAGGLHRRTASLDQAPRMAAAWCPSGTGPCGHPAGTDAPVRV